MSKETKARINELDKLAREAAKGKISGSYCIARKIAIRKGKPEPKYDPWKELYPDSIELSV